jgi:hypothetical protein
MLANGGYGGWCPLASVLVGTFGTFCHRHLAFGTVDTGIFVVSPMVCSDLVLPYVELWIGD